MRSGRRGPRLCRPSPPPRSRATPTGRSSREAPGGECRRPQRPRGSPALEERGAHGVLAQDLLGRPVADRAVRPGPGPGCGPDHVEVLDGHLVVREAREWAEDEVLPQVEAATDGVPAGEV